MRRKHHNQRSNNRLKNVWISLIHPHTPWKSSCSSSLLLKLYYCFFLPWTSNFKHLQGAIYAISNKFKNCFAVWCQNTTCKVLWNDKSSRDQQNGLQNTRHILTVFRFIWCVVKIAAVRRKYSICSVYFIQCWKCSLQSFLESFLMLPLFCAGHCS